MLLFDNYTRTDAPRYKAIYLEQESVPGRRPNRYDCTPTQDGMRVLVTAISEDHARLFYEREFWTPVQSLREV